MLHFFHVIYPFYRKKLVISRKRVHITVCVCAYLSFAFIGVIIMSGFLHEWTIEKLSKEADCLSKFLVCVCVCLLFSSSFREFVRGDNNKNITILYIKCFSSLYNKTIFQLTKVSFNKGNFYDDDDDNNSWDRIIFFCFFEM